MPAPKYHTEWLSLLEISGPFLSLNVLNRVFPNGLDKLSSEPQAIAELKAAYAEWLQDQADSAIHRAWVTYVLQTVLGWDETILADGQAIPESLHYMAVEHGGETIRPTFSLHERQQPAAVRLLVMMYPPETALEKPLPKKLWSASPTVRMLSLLHGTGVRLGLVTNGEQWMLVNAPPAGLAGYISWYAELWGEERETYRAFLSLLDVHRFFGVADEDTLPALLDESANDAQEITDQLGLQVRRAVEILVRALDKVDQDTQGKLLAGVTEAELYEASLTVMMRLVFLLSAEERGLFLLGDPLYDQNYAVSTLRAQLHEAADHSGEAVLERRSDAWSRLLATFRLVYDGSAHEDLLLPAYGGSLFDPDRFPFLEGRALDTPPAVNNRIVLHLLDALQILQMKGEARRLSFRAIDIEQIGHVYEGLLDHEARRATEVMLGLEGGQEPELPLSSLEAQNNLPKYLKEVTGRGEAPLKNALNRAPDPERIRRLSVACGDETLTKRVLPYLNLLREDELGYPLVILTGSVFVTAGTARRSSGTHYTPKSLTEPIVQHTLEPLVYRGVAEGAADWELKSPRELLALKICDMAMGSGAFLVQTCRYLADCLLEAWSRTPSPSAESGEAAGVRNIYGEPATNHPAEILLPQDEAERRTLALRLIADRCLYGVDKNPLAVEMAKLSLWLTTLAQGRPFTFLDHALKCGDSLVGVNLTQLGNWTLTPSDNPQAVPLLATLIRNQIGEVVRLRQELEAFPVLTVDDQQRKLDLLRQAETRTHDLRTAANYLLASAFSGENPAAQKAMRGHLLEVLQTGADVPDGYYPAVQAVESQPPFHWELEFPEVFTGRGGFDAFVGNPPFQGGQHLTGAHGVPYRDYLVNLVAGGQKGSADLCAYFFLRAFDHLRNGGTLGLIATNTIAQGDSRDVGLVQLVEKGGATLYRARLDMPWEGAAAVVVDVVHIYKGNYGGTICLDEQPVDFITPLLDDIAVEGRYLPHVLTANAGKSFQGSIVLGMGFVLEPEEAEALIQKDPRNAEVIFPYLNGEELNSQPDHNPTRWVINFFDWSEERAQTYHDCYTILHARVKPEREINRYSKSAREKWWLYERARMELYNTIAPLKRVLVASRVTKYVNHTWVSINHIFDVALNVIAVENDAFYAMFSSTFYINWIRRHASTMKQDTRYTLADCFETFPFPTVSSLPSLEAIGENYHETRRAIMLARWEGLTETYNRFHLPRETSTDIAELRRLQVEMDYAVAAAYGWEDLDLGHGFHETAQGIRYTLHDSMRREVLRRLLALNFERYAAEQALGVTAGKSKKKAAPKAADKPQETLF